MPLPPGNDADTPAIVVRFTPRDATSAPRILAEGSFAVVPDGSRRLAQGRIALDPGLWDVTAVVVEPGSGTNLVARRTVEISPRAPALHASDALAAASLEPVAYASLVSYEAAWMVGGMRVVPLAGRPVRRGEPVSVFAELYGGAPPYHASFQVDGREDDGRWTPLGKPQRLESTPGPLAWSMPIGARWPLGRYRVRIEAADAAGGTVTLIVPFTVAASSP